jgi:hypothetical protein
LFTTRKDFDKVIGFGKTAANNSIIIDFDEKNVFALTHKPRNEAIIISLRGVLKTDGVLKVNFQNNSASTQTYTSQPVYLIYLDKKDFCSSRISTLLFPNSN